MPTKRKTINEKPARRSIGERRGSAHSRGYDRDWQRLRDHYLAENPLCVMCRDRGETTAAECVDHVTPIAAGGERLDEQNLQALCWSCHSRKTVKEDGGFGHSRKR